MNNTFKADGKEYAINNPDIEEGKWEYYAKKSSMVAFIALNGPAGQIMFQWVNGICTMVSGVPGEIVLAAYNAPSIGKFYHASIKGKFTEADTIPNSITEVKEGILEVGDDDID